MFRLPKMPWWRGFFQEFGFTRASAADTLWTLEVAAYQAAETFIHLVESPGEVQGIGEI